MYTLISAEVVSAIALAVELADLLSRKDSGKSTRALALACLLGILFNLTDSAAYLTNGSGLPDALLYVINYFAYTASGFCYIAFANYCHVLISERTEVNPWLFRAPSILMGFSVFYVSMEIFTGHAFRFEGGVCTMISGIPVLCDALDFVLLLWLPAAALAKRKAVGLRAFFLIGVYSMAPVLATAVTLASGCYDYSPAAGALGLLAVCILLQNDVFRKKESEAGQTLAEKNEDLVAENEAQNTRLEEVTALNSRLEEASEDQKAQITEITAQNTRLRADQARMRASAEETRQANEAVTRLHEVLGSGAWSVWYDEDGLASRVEWSDNMRRILGYTDTSDFPNTLEPFIGAIHPDDVFTVLAATQMDVHSREDRADGYSIRLRMRLKSGEYHWYRNSAQAVRRADGSVSLFYGILADITGIEKTETELQEAMESIQAVNESLGAANWKVYCTLDGKVSRCVWGDAFRRLLGYTAEEFPDTLDAWTSKLHPEEKKEVIDSFRAAICAPGNVMIKKTCRMKTKDGKYRRYQSSARLTRNPDGSPKILYGICMDMDDQTAGEKKPETADNSSEAQSAK